MQVEKEAQGPSLAASVHANAKPVTKAVAWGSVAAGALALTLAAARTLREA